MSPSLTTFFVLIRHQIATLRRLLMTENAKGELDAAFQKVAQASSARWLLPA
jgi:hypothetical protein